MLHGPIFNTTLLREKSITRVTRQSICCNSVVGNVKMNIRDQLKILMGIYNTRNKKSYKLNENIIINVSLLLACNIFLYSF